MRPTVDEQLVGIDRLLETIGADPKLGPESALLVRDARRQLARLRGSLDARLPFLRWDNRATARLLQRVKPALSAEHQSSIDDLMQAEHDRAAEGGATEQSEADWNDRLRELLTSILQELPQTHEGDAARDAIVEHLRIRVDANPALNKNPIIPKERT